MTIPQPRQLKSGKWNVQITQNGKRQSITRQTREECLREAVLIKTHAKEIASGGAAEMTIGEIVDAYIESREGVLSPNTERMYRHIRERQFPRLMRLKYSAVKNWQKEVTDATRDVNPVSARDYWAVIRAALKASDLPVPSVVFAKPQPKPRPYLTPDEIPVFLEAIRGSRLELEILLGLHGLRAGEICAVRWEDVDLKRRQIRVDGSVYRSPDREWVRKETTKNAGSRRVVPFLIPRLEELLKERDRNAPLTIDSPPAVREVVNRICKKAGLPLIGGHGLRRSFASLAYHRQIPERVLMTLGGWESITTVHKHYIQISRDDVTRFSDDLRSFFGGGE